MHFLHSSVGAGSAGCLLIMVLMPASLTVYAEDGPRFEITPFIGYRLGGDLELEDTNEEVDLAEHGSWMLAFDVWRDDLSQYEFFYARQDTRLEGGPLLGRIDVNVEYLHLGGTLVVNDEHFAKPYIVATVGGTRLSPQSGTGSDETAFSVSFGGGLRVPFNDRFSLRLEARGYLSLMDADTALFCQTGEFGGVCRIRSSGSSFIQYDLLAGAAFAF